jgi:small subunit ribosomal protein S25e
MGSVKKKPLAAMEKNQQTQEEEAKPKKKGKETKPMSERKRPEVIAPKIGEQEMAKTLASLKAITIFGASKSLGVNASVARSILAGLEAKGLITKIGGFSGHYVWAAAS